MFTPPEIPLSGYNPPSTEAFLPPSKTTSMYPHQYDNTYAPPSYAPPSYAPPSQPAPDFYKPSFASGPPTQPPPSLRKIDPSQVYTAQLPVQNFTPKPFNPSPISQEKLAIFEPERRYQPPVIRRPLTVPNQRVSNVSPTPFSGSPYDSYSNAPWYSIYVIINSKFNWILYFNDFFLSGLLHHRISMYLTRLDHHQQTIIRSKLHEFRRLNNHRIRKITTVQHVDGENRRTTTNQYPTSLSANKHPSIFHTPISSHLRHVFNP